jgi:aldehyde:ferredoxin oxidoreductase
MKEFYKQRQLDQRGVPSAQKLADIGLEHLIVEFNAR